MAFSPLKVLSSVNSADKSKTAYECLIRKDMNNGENLVHLSVRLLDFIKSQILRHLLSWKTKLQCTNLVI